MARGGNQLFSFQDKYLRFARPLENAGGGLLTVTRKYCRLLTVLVVVVPLLTPAGLGPRRLQRSPSNDCPGSQQSRILFPNRASRALQSAPAKNLTAALPASPSG